VDDTWTLTELVEQVAQRLAALPAPKNGQVRAVPDERTIRYYGTLGLLDRPVATRGRTALYGRRHLAQVVAIKRLQAAGRSLSEIQTLWPTFDDAMLARISGVSLDAARRAPAPSRAARPGFWRGGQATSPASSVVEAPASEPLPSPSRATTPPSPPPSAATTLVELRVELASGVVLALALPSNAVTSSSSLPSSLSPDDVRAIRAAAVPLVSELARRQLITPTEE
jgi:hypothetical protein